MAALRLWFQSDRKFYYILKLICSLLLVSHLCFLAYDFSNCKKVEKVVNDPTTDDRFPSFSLCSNVPIRQDNGNDSTYFKKFIELEDVDLLGLMFDMIFNNKFSISNHRQNTSDYWNVAQLTKGTELDVLSQFAKLNESQRIEYAQYPLDRLGISLYLNNSLQGLKSYREFKYLLSNNLYYGNCMTFNPAWFKDDNMHVDKKPEIVVLQNDVPLHRNGLLHQTDMPWKNKILVIHPVDAEPIFDSKNIIKIPADSNTIITISRTKYELKTDCVKNLNLETENEDWVRGDYLDEKNYTYSYEGCLASCLQNLTIEYCECQLSYLQLGNDMRVCRGCRKIPEKKLAVQCGCKYPCRYFRFALLTESMTHTFTKTEERLFNGDKQYQIQIGNGGLLYGKTFEYRLGETKISFLKGATKVQTTIIESSCKSEVLFSQIGGVLGLYMGLSIFSFVEFIFQGLSKLRVTRLRRLLENQNGNQFSVSVANHLKFSRVPMKVIWLIILFGASYTTFDQSVTLFQAYYQYPVIYQTTEVNQVEFPSVTVCSNNLIPEEQYVRNTAFFDSLKNSSVEAYNASSFDELWYSPILIQAQPRTTRLSMGTSLISYMPACYYTINNEKINCSKFIEYSLGKLGNCVTINAGILKEGDEEADITSLTMELKTTRPKQILLVGELGVTVIMHPKGTSANNYQFRKNLILKPSHSYEIAFSTTVREHLSEPYPTKCVSQTDSFQQWRNLFHTHETPYLYTLGECMASCDYNTSLLWRCVEIIEFNYQGRLAVPDDIHIGAAFCAIDPNNITEHTCNCEMPCREVEIEFEVVKQDKTGENTGADASDKDYQDSMNVFAGDVLEPSLNYSQLASSWLKLYPKTLKTTITKEEPAIHLFTLLSDIGGTMGLWLGISVLALVELNCALLFKLFKI